MDDLRAVVTRGYELLETIKQKYGNLGGRGLAYRPPSREEAANLLVWFMPELNVWHSSVSALLGHDDLIRFRHCPKQSHFDEWPTGDGVGQICNQLLSQLLWLDKLASTSRAAKQQPNPSALDNRPKNINAKMLETLQQDIAAMGWTAQQWARHLKCSKGSIGDQPTWKDLMMRRERERAERANDRRHKRKPVRRSTN